MRGGLRWPFRPFQVTCVLVAVLLTAAFSLKLHLGGYAEDQLIQVKPNIGSLYLGNLGERLNTKTIAIIFGNPKANRLTIGRARSDAIDDGDNSHILPLVDKDGAARRISGQAGGRAECDQLRQEFLNRPASKHADEKRNASHHLRPQEYA